MQAATASATPRAVSWMDEVAACLADDLARVDSHIDEVYQVEGALMGDVAAHVRGMRGKMLRPAIVCLSARAFGFDTAGDLHTRLGASIELFHVATLLHDDVIDKAPERRGRPTVNARWGDDVAILFADYLYASSFDLALHSLKPQVLRLLARTTQRMTEGEMFQIEKRGQWLAVSDYLEIIEKKTALLFSASAGLGSLLADASLAQVERMASFGLDFGMAFQITDDALDYEAQGDRWGKRVGADVKEGKQTLPLLHALASADEADRAALVATLENGRDFETIHRLVRKYDGIGHALGRARDYARRAGERLEAMGDGEAVRLLRGLSEGVAAREA